MSKSRTLIAGNQPRSIGTAKTPVPQPDELRRADEGDVEQEHEDRDAAHHLDVEGGDLAEHPAAREAAEGHDQPERDGEREGDEGDPERHHHALAERAEDDRIVAVGGDQPGEEHAEEDDREQPVGDLAAGTAGRRGVSATLIRRRPAPSPGSRTAEVGVGARRWPWPPPAAPASTAPPGTRRTTSGSACRRCRRPSSTGWRR